MVISKNDLIKKVERNSEIKAFLTKYVKSAIGINTNTQNSPKEKNSSKFGGVPYIANNFKWPSYKGKPMSFICQINLQDIEKMNTIFPKKGILYFFWDTNFNEEYLEFPHSIIYDDLENDNDKNYSLKKEAKSITFKEQAISFYEYLSLPDGELPNYIHLDSNIDDDELFEFTEEIENEIFNRYSKKHHILGHPNSLQNAVQESWAIQDLSIKLEETNTIKNREKINSIASDFELLLQIDFEDENINFSEYASTNSRFYFGIRKEHLEDRNFDKSFLTYQNF